MATSLRRDGKKRFNTGSSTCWSGGSGWEAKGSSAVPVPSFLSEGTTYYWRVVSENGANRGFSATRTFTVYGQPQTAPTLSIQDLNGNGDFEVSWTKPAGTVTSYNLVQTAPTNTTISTSGRSQTFLDKTGTYSFRVQACNATGCGPFSSLRSITIGALTGPTLVAPVDNATASNSGNFPCFTWSGVPTDHYNLTISLSEEFPTQRWQKNFIDDSETLACWDSSVGWEAKGTNPIPLPTNLADGTTYYWRVLSFRGGEIGYSETRSFTTPVPDPIDDGVYVGDINSDGLYDFYVRQMISPLADTGSFLLQQNPDNSFSVVASLTGAQQNAVDLWEATAIELLPADYNVDGSLDLALKGIEGLFVDGVPVASFDQMVFAPAPPEVVALTATAMDADFKQFFFETYNWILNVNYFEDNATEVETVVWYTLPNQNLALYCDLPPYSNNPGVDFPAYDVQYNGSLVEAQAYFANFETDCEGNNGNAIIYSVNLTYRETGIVLDYSGFNQNALAARDLLSPNLNSPEDQASATDVAQLENILRGILQVGLQLPAPGSVVELSTAIPFPGEYDRPTAPRLPKLSWFGLFLYLLDLAESANGRAQDERMVYHYVIEGGRAVVVASGEIRNRETPVGGNVWFTYLAYPSSDVAVELLSLCGPPRVGYFIVKQANIPTLGFFTRVLPYECDDGTVRFGGGWEAIAVSPVNALPLRFVPIRENL